jgi:hypothetical protein
LDQDAYPKSQETLAIERIRPGQQRTRIAVSAVIGVFALLVGSMWMYRAPRGAMRIEITDEQIEVTLGATGRSLRGTRNETVKLPVGEHVLHVKLGETTLDTPEITVAKGEPVEIKVERVGNRVRVMRDGQFLVAKEMPKSKSTGAQSVKVDDTAITSGNPERAAAEWVINNGGDVVVDPSSMKVAKLGDLPKEPFAIRVVTLRKMPSLTVADVDRLVGLRELKELHLEQTTLSVEVARRIAETLSIETLTHGTSTTTPAAFLEFTKLRTLRYFSGVGVDVDDEFLAQVGQLKRLNHLTFNGCKKVTEEGVVCLSANPPPKLNTVALGGMKVVTVNSVRAIAQLPHLGTLGLGKSNISEGALAELQRCPA